MYNQMPRGWKAGNLAAALGLYATVEAFTTERNGQNCVKKIESNIYYRQQGNKGMVSFR